MMANHSKIRGRIVLVSFPFDDLSSSKVRPALCLTEPVGPYRHVIVAFVTSRLTPDILPSDLQLLPSDLDFNMTGLHSASTLRLHRVVTIPAAMIQREIGHLTDDRMNQVKSRLVNLLELKQM